MLCRKVTISLGALLGEGLEYTPTPGVFLRSYVRSADCDRGEWVFRDGEPVALGTPTLVHYDDLFERPDPHYIED